MVGCSWLEDSTLRSFVVCLLNTEQQLSVVLYVALFALDSGSSGFYMKVIGLRIDSGYRYC